MFTELLDNPNRIEPGTLQATAGRRFPSVLQRSHLRERRPGGLPTSGKWAIIGVATYSSEDLAILDEVEAAHPNWGGNGEVYVFDIAQCKSMTEVLEHVPPFQSVMQTPVVVIADGDRSMVLETGGRMTIEALRREGFVG